MRDYSVNTDRAPDTIRSDANTNRKAIVLAARRLFAVDMDISLTDIANEAGVSRATLYRNFSDLESIILEIFNYNLQVLEAYSRKIMNDENRFLKLLKVVVEQQSKYQALTFKLSSRDNKIVERLFLIFREPIIDAKEKGFLRSDFSIRKDLLLLLMMLGGALIMNNDNEKDRVERALQLIMEGVRN